MAEQPIFSDLLRQTLDRPWQSVEAWARHTLQGLAACNPYLDHLVSFDPGQADDWTCISQVAQKDDRNDQESTPRRLPPLPNQTLLTALGPLLKDPTDPAIHLRGQDLKIWAAFLSAAGRKRGIVHRPTRRAQIPVLIAVLFADEQGKHEDDLNHHILFAHVCGAVLDREWLAQETDQLRQALTHQEAFSTLGHLLAGFAHDLGTPLQAILNSAEVIERGQQRHDPVTEARQIMRAALRARGMIQDLIAFTRTDSFPLSAVSPVESVLDALELRRFTPSDPIDVQVLAKGDVSPVLAHPDRLIQVLVNLLDNAHYAVLAEGRGGIRVSFAQGASDAPDEVAIIIENDGPVIPRTVASRLFDHGFTTKPRGQGSGIGLSIARRLTELMGGTLNYDPSFASGTRMVLKLKIAKGKETRPNLEPSPRRKQTARVLIVDDDEELVQSYAAILGLEGFQVLLATRAKAALDLLRSETVDAILCDFHLPDLSAPAFQEQLQKQFPTMVKRVIYATGDEVDPKVQKFLRECTTPTLIKPFRLDQFLRALRQTIEGAEDANPPAS
ncbi:MAG TPA: hybrid sensor histidine kinase/response regulator [Planctomycetota bacterium]|nr:hybrid sensor histidine kinase/response regulator [Planctomycetota bacterium]